MHWEHPNLLWLLLVVPPALALFFWWRERSRRRIVAQFIEARLLSALTVGISPRHRKIRYSLLVLAAAFLIVALARPQYGFDLHEVEESGLDIVVAVDTSKSMLAQDTVPNRLERAKLAALELMQDAQSDRLGLEAFAGQAFLECPLTVDNTAFEQSVQGLDVNSVSQGGTGIANAIDNALTAFKENGHFKTLILLTDGEDNVNDTAALESAKKAAKAGLKIFTVGIGTTEGALIRVAGPDGNSDYIRDASGNVVKTHLNETLLRQIAGATGGFYLPLRGADTMDVLYDRGLAPLPRSLGVGRKIRHYHEQYQWPLSVAILLLIAEIFLLERKRSNGQPVGGQPPSYAFSRAEEPVAAAKAGAVPPVIAVALLAGLLLLPVAASASPGSALRAYNSGNYTNALQEYSNLADIQTNDFRLVFNEGDAAYRTTNYDLAQILFNQVTLSPDINLQQKAYYNLGNTQFQAAKQATDLDGLQSGFETAEKSYARAVDLNTNDADAVFNWKFTKDAIERIKEFREMLRRAKKEADLDVQQAEFHKALQIMAPLQSSLQKTPAAKQFEDFTKKLQQIDEIETPHTH
ncbi:MAG TPA: VWA domain-containing protein [Verrucomicrobiae bacterium]|jgi:Ca-activated chloride channel family protein|nr:VWA domain-containing protein [Verrucomicrobiae bacterium]